MLVACALVVFCGSTDIHTAIDGADNTLCHVLSPCSFKMVKDVVTEKDIVFVKGKYMDRREDLEQLSELFNCVLAKGAVIMSDNMTVNGSLYSTERMSFIVCQKASSSRIHQWHFTGFRMTILCFRTVERGVISDSVFSRNHVVGGIGMLEFGVGKCKLENCNFTENSVYHSSLISMFSTHLYLNLTRVERNWVMHESRQALMFAVNSVCEYTNTTFKGNHSPHAPLHQFEFRSCFGFWNCTFEENKHHEVLLCDGTCEFNFTNTTVVRNMGSFLTTSPHSQVTFNESWITQNYSGDMPLFDIPGASFVIFHPCLFVGNTGASIFDLRGMKSNIDIRHAHFRSNKVSEFLIGADTGSVFKGTSCTFSDNRAPMGALFLNSSKAEMSASKIRRELRGLYLAASTTTLRNITFSHPHGPSVITTHGRVTIRNTTFIGDVIGGHIRITHASTKSLRHLKFTSTKNRALSPSLALSCWSCTFAGRKQNPNWIAYLSIGLCIAIVIVCLRPPHIFLRPKAPLFEL